MADLKDIINDLKRGTTSAAEFVAAVEAYLVSEKVAPSRTLAALDAADVWLLLEDDEHERLTAAITQLLHNSPAYIALDIPDPDSTVTVLCERQSTSTPADPEMQFATEHPEADRMMTGGDKVSGDATAELQGVVLKGRFRLLDRIGVGGTSNVYRAIDNRKMEARAADPYVAVKILRLPEQGRQEALIMLQQEVQKSQTLAHPNIVRVFDFDRDESIVFMTMEYLEGASLRSLIADGAFQGEENRPKALEVVAAIAVALSFAHRNQIVHGDLKPGNVFVTKTNQVKVIDFGIARAFGRVREAGGTAVSTNRGPDGYTPAYASPEKLEGGEPDPAHDVYALACITYEVLTGHHPFSKRSGVVARNFTLEVPHDSSLSTTQYEAIKRALEFDWERRTRSADDFLAELTQVAGSARWTLKIAAAAGSIAIFAAIAYWGIGDREPTAATGIPLEPEKPAEGTRLQDCAVCPPLIVVGTPVARDSNDGDIAGSAANVPVAIAVNEVTVGEFGAFVAAANYQTQRGCMEYDGEWRFNVHRNWQDPGFHQTSSHPVTCISWHDATAYTDWLSETTGNTYRLLFAAEWLYAAALRPDQELCEAANVADLDAEQQFPGWSVANCSDNAVFTTAVASYVSNSLGLNDTAGNVFEWIADCADPSCESRQLRGGSWFSVPAYSRPEAYSQFAPDTRATTFGLRVAREIIP